MFNVIKIDGNRNPRTGDGVSLTKLKTSNYQQYLIFLSTATPSNGKAPVHFGQVVADGRHLECSYSNKKTEHFNYPAGLLLHHGEPHGNVWANVGDVHPGAIMAGIHGIAVAAKNAADASFSEKISIPGTEKSPLAFFVRPEDKKRVDEACETIAAQTLEIVEQKREPTRLVQKKMTNTSEFELLSHLHIG